jgi:hypothetical protein
MRNFSTFNHSIFFNSIQYFIISIQYIINSIIINNITSQYIHSTPEFTWKPKWEKTVECISYISKEYIHWKHQLLDSPATTRRRIQTPIIMLQPEGSYNSLNSLAPTRRKLQPPEFSSSNRKVDTTTHPCPILPP